MEVVELWLLELLPRADELASLLPSEVIPRALVIRRCTPGRNDMADHRRSRIRMKVEIMY